MRFVIFFNLPIIPGFTDKYEAIAMLIHQNLSNLKVHSLFELCKLQTTGMYRHLIWRLSRTEIWSGSMYIVEFLPKTHFKRVIYCTKRFIADTAKHILFVWSHDLKLFCFFSLVIYSIFTSQGLLVHYSLVWGNESIIFDLWRCKCSQLQFCYYGHGPIFMPWEP